MLVSVLMPTYNHGDYIAQAIDSFLEQRTDFQIELLIGDDCSTDNTQSIAAEYAIKHPNKIKLFEAPSNQGLMKNYKNLIEHATGQYLAILESDDIWIDPLKLQKQVDFMAHNPDCGMVFSNWINIDKNSNEISRSTHKNVAITYKSTLEIGNSIAAVTVLFSKKLYDNHCNIDDYINHGFKTFDLPTWLTISAHSSIGFINDFTAGYRHIATSISNSGSYTKAVAFNENIDQIVDYITSKFGYLNADKNIVHNAKCIRNMICAMQYGELNLIHSLKKQIKVISAKYLIIKYLTFIWICRNRHLINNKKY